MPKEEPSYSLRSRGDASHSDGLPPVTRKKRDFQFSNQTADSGLGNSHVPEYTSDESSGEELNNKTDNTVQNLNTSNNLIQNIPSIQIGPVNREENIVPNNDPNNPENMVLLANQTISLNDALVCVPRFDGNDSDLIDFASCCRDAKAMLPAAVEGNLVKLIYGRELGRIYQKENESVIDYVNRLRQKSKEITEWFLSNNLEATEDQVTEFKNQIDASVAECFTQNLRNEIDQRMPACVTVEDALANAIQIEKKLNARNELRKDPNEREIDAKKSKPVKFISNNNNSNNSDKLRNLTDKTNSANNNFNKPNTSKLQNSQMRCHRCQKPGHFARECPESAAENCQICNKSGHSVTG
ncbi:putative uncharacterized protein DDB_G0286901 [Microplitis demolitor]|uniref:putative uncharacterized protein DDB_G0286901 n=1 Tax=Microplitis demolitor TaxID=69319 RepID=UPI00235B7096|nr:putative uncharacterized protein DDB_G0286901 [Microplitis demolitor]